MSTRAQIIVKDSFGDELWFYRHSDGYPEGAMPMLEKFMDCVKEGLIRDNAEQAAGWLILFGAWEYNTTYDWVGDKLVEKKKTTYQLFNPGPKKDMMGWKCGSIEPSVPRKHGDIEWLYTLDLAKKTIKKKHI